MKFETYPFEKLNQLLSGVIPNSNYEPLSLTIGEPQFETPKEVQDELCASSSLLNRYPKTAGEEYLKDAMLSYLKRRFNLELSKEELIPTFGTRELLFNFPQFYLFDKKEPTIAFCNPFYQIYEGSAIASRAKIIHLNLEPKNNFLPQIDEEVLKKCDLVILNSPNNPTASVIGFDELKRWVKLALEYDFFLINDECYIDLYLDKPLPSLLEASVAIGNSEFKNVAVVNSISKRLSAPGLRSGFIAGNKDILGEYLRYRTYIGCASPLPLQKASAKAWLNDKDAEYFRDKYRANFKIAKEILGITPPEATFYIWLEVEDELEFTKGLYEKFNLKVLPGSFLGRGGVGRGFVRLALVYEEELMKEALNRVAKFIKEAKR